MMGSIYILPVAVAAQALFVAVGEAARAADPLIVTEAAGLARALETGGPWALGAILVAVVAHLYRQITRRYDALEVERREVQQKILHMAQQYAAGVVRLTSALNNIDKSLRECHSRTPARRDGSLTPPGTFLASPPDGSPVLRPLDEKEIP